MTKIEELLKKLCKDFIIEETRSKFKYKIVTPFTLPGGESISFIAQIISENEILLDDKALIFRYFDLNFFEPKNIAIQSMDEICKNFGIVSGDSFQKIIDVNDRFGSYDFYDYLNALIRLSDILMFKLEARERNDFIERLINYVKQEFDVKFRYFSEGIKPYDPKNDFKVDIALSKNEDKWVLINGIYSQSRIPEINLSLMHYKYQQKLNIESILVFDNMDGYTKSGGKLNRLLNYIDTPIPTFDNDGMNRLHEIIEKRLA